jgi:ubiquinone/menaquinone biosynthesis C-methylase UbiE
MATIQVNGTSRYCEDTGGAAPPIVFSHGLLWNTEPFAPQIAVLNDRHPCVAYDHRGQGKSADGTGRAIDMDIVTDDAAALIEALPYFIHSDEECQRLELQAGLANIQGHLRHLPISANDRVLDVGCGSGSMARLIARSFPQAKVVGVDLREQYLEFAKARARDEGIQNLTFRHGDVFALPFADASFDVVWTKYLLQWVKEPKGALAELKRVTKPGGFFVSCDYVGFAIEHRPAAPEFDRQVREVMAALVDCNIGRKVSPFMMSLGFQDVHVEMETDTLFTVIGSIDAERRWNWEKQFQAARPHLIQIVGSELDTDRLIDRFLAHYDDPATCSFTALYFTRGRVS